jgi:hypothetical protein
MWNGVSLMSYAPEGVTGINTCKGEGIAQLMYGLRYRLGNRNSIPDRVKRFFSCQ